MVWETWVQSQVASYRKTLKMVLDTSLLNNVCTINKSAHTKKVWKLIVCPLYIRFFFYLGFILLLLSLNIRGKSLPSPPKNIQKKQIKKNDRKCDSSRFFRSVNKYFIVVGWLFKFYGISTFIAYLTSNTNNQFYFKQFS